MKHEDEFAEEHPVIFLVILSGSGLFFLALVLGWIDIGLGGWILLIGFIVAVVAGTAVKCAVGLLAAIGEILRGD